MVRVMAKVVVVFLIMVLVLLQVLDNYLKITLTNKLITYSIAPSFWTYSKYFY